MNRMERFTNRARHALSLAQESSEAFRHKSIGTEHLLLGLLRDEGGVAGKVLRDLGLNQKQVETLVKQLSGDSTQTVSTPELSTGAKRTLEKAVEQARKLGHHYIGTEHLLLGLVEQKNSTAMTILDRLGITAQQVRQFTLAKLQEPALENETVRPFPSIRPPLEDERRKVLDMIDEGEITALEGAELLKALQVAAVPFPFPLGATTMLMPASGTPLEHLQNRFMRLVVKKEDGTEIEFRHPMRQVQGEYFLLMQRFYDGQVGKILDMHADDKTIDVYIDETEDEDKGAGEADAGAGLA
jgi:hypothetical protein